MKICFDAPQNLELALGLHFASLPAQLALRLFVLGQQNGWYCARQIDQVSWNKACEEYRGQYLGKDFAHYIAALPNQDEGWQSQANWKRYQRSLPQAEERSRACMGYWAPQLQNNVEDEGGNQIVDTVLRYGSSVYPQGLYRLYRAPFVVFGRTLRKGRSKNQSDSGHFLFAQQDSSGFAVCGSRKVTLRGRRDAYSLAYGVMEHGGFHLVSGLSEGIELAACEGALAAHPCFIKIVGVLCCGFDALAPAESQQMASRILRSGGLLLSEYPPLQPRQHYTFLQRNRILAALAPSLIMVELGPKTRALNLVDYALELNHDVAVLGESLGVEKLRQQGCSHWQSAEELLRALRINCQITEQQIKPGEKIGRAVARNLYGELQGKNPGYLGQRIEKD